jgi:hypothetical protein
VGSGVAAPLDHFDMDQVQTLAGQIRNEHGHLHVLVNEIWDMSWRPTAQPRLPSRRVGFVQR